MQSVRKWSITRVALLILVSLCVANLVNAQDANTAQTGKIDRTAAASTGSEKSSSEKNSAEKIAEPKAASAKPATNSAAAKVNSAEKVKDETKTQADAAVKNTPAKRVDSAVINLQTTVTGNQEQPRVMYILPWQSPAPEDVDFESLENQTKSVFGHIERDELRRELEATEKKATEKK